MSRIGKLPIAIPKGVTASVEQDVVSVEGPKGKLEQKIRDDVTVTVEEDKIVVGRVSETKVARSYHGLFRKLISNMVVGVSEGFTKTLLINGVGYRVEMKGKNLLFFI